MMVVPINNPSKFFCSHRVPKQFSPKNHQNCVRDWGRVLNGAPQFLGRPEEELRWQADVCRVQQSRKSRFSALPGFVQNRGQICFLRGSRPRFFLRDGKLVTFTLSWKPSRTRGRETDPKLVTLTLSCKPSRTCYESKLHLSSRFWRSPNISRMFLSC